MGKRSLKNIHFWLVLYFLYACLYYSGVLKIWRNSRPNKCKVAVSNLLSTSVDRSLWTPLPTGWQPSTTVSSTRTTSLMTTHHREVLIPGTCSLLQTTWITKLYLNSQLWSSCCKHVYRLYAYVRLFMDTEYNVVWYRIEFAHPYSPHGALLKLEIQLLHVHYYTTRERSWKFLHGLAGQTIKTNWRASKHAHCILD